MFKRPSIKILLAVTIGLGFTTVAMAEEVSISKLKEAVTDVKLRVWIIERCTADPKCKVVSETPPNGDDGTIKFVLAELEKEIAVRESEMLIEDTNETTLTPVAIKKRPTRAIKAKEIKK